MSEPVVKKFDGESEAGYTFWCPGCEMVHKVVTSPNGWTFNGDEAKPTFGPSLLVRGGHYVPGWEGPRCYCNQPRDGLPASWRCFQCHSFVENGMIRFLDDCSHAFAGHPDPVPLPPLSSWRGD